MAGIGRSGSALEGADLKPDPAVTYDGDRPVSAPLPESLRNSASAELRWLNAPSWIRQRPEGATFADAGCVTWAGADATFAGGAFSG